ncbi:MAG: biopolymer transporter ExbD [Calditrichaeota bacterium]|nr:MAG: biopolymer transporter ExbD [Calditrichota bacterium]MBL1206710.1 biopolymer transporter ExbD [Calditrichota bacterium]NOG46536.1 biopolymer transporter ExbD [Calditrichota bacterium]
MAFQPSKSKRHQREESGALNMNSMMDMMTIILLFLLKSFSAEGALVTASEELKLPESFMGDKPKKELQVSVTKDAILVNNNALMPVSDVDSESVLIQPLYTALAAVAQEQQQLEIDFGTEFTHTVIIQGDQTVPFEMLYKIMFTCSKSQFYKMRLLTIKKG